MLQVSNLTVKLAEEDKTILHDVNLTVNPGEVHLLNGRNGSGKSTLVNAIMGNPSFEIIGGNVTIQDETYSKHIFQDFDSENLKDFVKEKDGKVSIEINELEPNERSLSGLFLASQYPIEIPGVSLSNYLRLIYNKRQSDDKKLPVFKFRKLLEEKAKIINYPENLLKRNLNEGFSGGEKKKTEILQMLLLHPRYVMLDEIDSGLDRESVKEVFGGLAALHAQYSDISFIIITHYDRVQEYLKPDSVHEMVSGELK